MARRPQLLRAGRGHERLTRRQTQRGVDLMNGAYNYIDLTPKGRDEAGQKPGTQAWVRRRDEYDL